jgi:hypothetical protein
MRGRVYLCIAIAIFLSNSANAEPRKINILWGALSRPWTLQLVTQELEKPIHAGDVAPATVNVLNLTTLQNFNPFRLTPRDFSLGLSRPYEGETIGPVPGITPEQAAFFDKMVETNQYPDVFVIAGHQVISEGWHNEAESMFLYLPTLLDTLRTYPNARKFFDHIRLAVLWGCNAMTDLEPHGPHGEFLDSAAIKALYNSGPAGKALVIGSEDKVNTLEFYRSRLAREYGPGSAKFEYTRSRSKEKCFGPGKYDNCDVTNLDRILPDKFLFDGSHLYNYPYMMKRVFPNTTLVLGYSSASPSEEERVKILKATFDKSYGDLNLELKASGKRINNILYPLVDPASPDTLNKEIIKVIRKNWTLESNAVNRERPSGSITPLYPDLDADGVLGAPLSRGSYQYGPYEKR